MTAGQFIMGCFVVAAFIASWGEDKRIRDWLRKD